MMDSLISTTPPGTLSLADSSTNPDSPSENKSSRWEEFMALKFGEEDSRLTKSEDERSISPGSSMVSGASRIPSTQADTLQGSEKLKQEDT